jgi:hypothetical protein
MIKAAPLPSFEADCAEDLGRGGALIAGPTRTGAALLPTAGDLVLPANALLVLEPNLYCLRRGPPFRT